MSKYLTNRLKAIDSREVAEMIGKEHKHLLRDIKGYAEILNQSNFGLVNFFIKTTYQDSKGETRPCYLLTKKGCEMVANKMTGEKGVLFTAAYVTRFEEMEKQLSGQNQQLPKANLEKAARAEAMLINAKTRRANLLVKMATSFKDQLSSESIQLLLAGAAETTMGKSLLPKPVIDVHFTATEIAEELGISANMVGRIANKHGLKISENGMWVLDKSKHADKQVKSFVYNEKGRKRLIELSETQK